MPPDRQTTTRSYSATCRSSGGIGADLLKPGMARRALFPATLRFPSTPTAQYDRGAAQFDRRQHTLGRPGEDPWVAGVAHVVFCPPSVTGSAASSASRISLRRALV